MNPVDLVAMSIVDTVPASEMPRQFMSAEGNDPEFAKNCVVVFTIPPDAADQMLRLVGRIPDETLGEEVVQISKDANLIEVLRTGIQLVADGKKVVFRSNSNLHGTKVGFRYNSNFFYIYANYAIGGASVRTSYHEMAHIKRSDAVPGKYTGAIVTRMDNNLSRLLSDYVISAMLPLMAHEPRTEIIERLNGVTLNSPRRVIVF